MPNNDRSTLATDSMDTTPRNSIATEVESIAPSESASQRTIGGLDGDVTPRALSPARTLTDAPPRRRENNTSNSGPYRGFASEAEYLAALREWAETKKYIQQNSSVIGFYGPTTTQELASKPRIELGIRRMLKERKAKKSEKPQSTS